MSTAANRLEQDPAAAEIERVVDGSQRNPHGVLGAHVVGRSRIAVRVWRPDATAVTVLVDGREAPAELIHEAGFWVAEVPGNDVPAYRLRVRYGEDSYEIDDPYRFWPTVGDLDIHLFNEGRHEQLWRALGARPMTHQGVDGTAFSVWAPNARAVRVVGDFCSWDGRLLPMRSLGSSGIWELFVPGVGPGRYYKFEVVDAAGHLRLKADPMAQATEAPPGQASVVAVLGHRAPRPQVDLVDRHRLVQQVRRRPLLDPRVVLPGVRAAGDHARLAGRGLGGLRHRIGLEPQVAGGIDDLELVVPTGPDTGDEQLPDAARPERPHGQEPAVPRAEVAHDPHGAGVGRPHRELSLIHI